MIRKPSALGISQDLKKAVAPLIENHNRGQVVDSEHIVAERLQDGRMRLTLSDAVLKKIGLPDPSLPAPRTYWNVEQSYTAHCPEGTTGEPVTYTVNPRTFSSSIDQASADAAALAYAQSQAEAALDCAPSGPPGCTDPAAINYDPAAVIDDGSCLCGTSCLFTTVTVSGSFSYTDDCGAHLEATLDPHTLTRGVDFDVTPGTFCPSETATVDGTCPSVPDCCTHPDTDPPDCEPDPDCVFYNPFDRQVQVSCVLDCITPGFLNVGPSIFAQSVFCSSTCNSREWNDGAAPVDIPCDEVIGTHVFSIFGGVATVVVTFA
jgi:hypothetical protein